MADKIINHTKKELLIGEVLHYSLFYGLPKYFGELVSPDAVENMLMSVSRTAMIKGIRDSAMIKGFLSGKSFHNVFLTCYKLYEALGYKFDAEKVSETKTKYVGRVIECPHIKFTRANPVACFSCFGIKQGILHELLGYVPVTKIKKRMALGDPYCEFEVLKNEREQVTDI